MEESCEGKRFTTMIQSLIRLLNAVFPGRQESPAAAVPSPSPVSPAEIIYIPVSKPDAIAKLCIPTGDEQLDEVHIVLIDLLQRNYIYAVCTDNDPTLRYSATDEGKAYVREHINLVVEDLLGRAFDD